MECEKCGMGSMQNAKILMITFTQKRKDIVWYCSNCQKINKLDSGPETEKQLLLRYVDDIFSTVNGEPDILLRKVNTLNRK